MEVATSTAGTERAALVFQRGMHDTDVLSKREETGADKKLLFSLLFCVVKGAHCSGFRVWDFCSLSLSQEKSTYFPLWK